MNKILLLLAMMLPIATHAETADGDTVVIKKPREVTVITNDSLQQIVVKGRYGDEGYVYKNSIQIVDSNYVSTTTVDHELRGLMPRMNVASIDSMGKGTKMELMFRMGWGIVAPKSDGADMDFSTSNSGEIWFSPLTLNVYLNRSQHDLLSCGLGFNWRNYRMDGYDRFMKDENGDVRLGDYPEGAKPKFSRIKVFSITGTLLYEHNFGNSFGLGLGIVSNWNTYASIKTRYKTGNTKHKEVEKHIGQRRFTLDYMAVVRTPALDFYLKYSPQSVLKDSGVKFHSLTFGLCL